MDFVEIIAIGNNKELEHLRLFTFVPTDSFVVIEVLIQDKFITVSVL